MTQKHKNIEKNNYQLFPDFFEKVHFLHLVHEKIIYLLICMFVKQVVQVKIEARNILYKTKKNDLFLE